MNDTRAGRDAAPVISLEDVTKRYGGVTAVERACFEIRRGEFFSLLGPSGCGKTTLIRMIAGFEDATSGRIRLEGADVSRVPPFRRNVNTVFQQYALFPHLNVFDNVAFGPRARGLVPAEVKRRVERMLDVVRLGDFASRRPEHLSGGQKQRVALARALVNFPSALLLDEPLSALDRNLRQAMQIELKRIQRELGITFVVVTHDQEEALTMSDRIAVMSAGRIEQIGTPEEIYAAPATAFVAGFIGSANLLPVTVERTTTGGAIVRLPDGGRAEVPTAGGRLEAGAPAIVMVRPEHLKLAVSAGEAASPAIRVTLVELVFQGAVQRCVLRDAAGNELVAHLRPRERPAGLKRGTTAWVSWAAGDAHLLPGPPVLAGWDGARPD